MLLGVNALAVVLGVLPMSRAVASAEQRAAAATADARVAASELADASAARDGRDGKTVAAKRAGVNDPPPAVQEVARRSAYSGLRSR